MNRGDSFSEAGAVAVDAAHLRATGILDYLSEPVQAVVRRLEGARGSGVGYLRAAHGVLRAEVRPVYTVDELQAASVTIAKGKGSGSQRFACLEAVARAGGIGTRVRGLWIAGRFWGPRFPVAKVFMPGR